MTLRGYFVSGYEGLGVAVVASTAKEAKKIGHESVESMDGSKWTEISVKWIRGADISGIIEPAVLSLTDGLRRGIFGFVDGITCEVCGREDAMCEMLNGKIIACLDCINEQEGVPECV